MNGASLGYFGSPRRVGGVALVAALTLLVAGCGPAPTAHFRLNMQGMTPDDFQITGRERAQVRARLAGPEGKNPVDNAQLEKAVADELKRKETLIGGRQIVADAMLAMFGTPDEPYVFPETGLDLAQLRFAAGPVVADESGTKSGLYRQHCVHCHGITGDGAGPTAVFLNPYPRDFRKGVFKWKATQRAAKPRREDLHRVLRDGVAGTAMPSFALLRQDELDALVEYVIYLSMRGETEDLLRQTVLMNEEDPPASRQDLVDNYLGPVAQFWSDAGNQVLAPGEKPPVSDPVAWAAKGAEIFRGSKAQCMKCHGPTALGDGSEEKLFDDWNKEKPDHGDLGWWLLPKQQIQPRNLRLNVYRGGRSPADIYRRIAAGINGTPMPAAGAPGVLSSEEIWALVDYVRGLPYDVMSDPAPPTPLAHRPVR